MTTVYNEPETNHSPDFYDLEYGKKMSISRTVESSPRRYSILRSNAPRLAVEKKRHNVPFAAYDLDTAHRKTLSSRSRDCRVFLSACFDSEAARFPRPWTSPAADVLYDPDRLQNSKAATIEKNLETTQAAYAILRSRYKRFQDKPLTCGPDAEYDIDSGRKASLYKLVQQSPRSYSNMSSQSSRQRPQTREQYAEKLGPGSYDYSRQQDVNVSSTLHGLPLSSMRSRSSRFHNDRIDPTKTLGSPWKEDYDKKSWAKPVTISTADYVRPQYLPKAYKKKQSEGYKTESK